MAKSWTIYKATSPSGKSYIGQTRQSVRVRLRHHKYEANGDRSTTPFHKAIRKYGLDSFQVEELGQVHSQIEADEMEIFFIEKFDTRNSRCGYNAAPGGMRIVNVDKTKERIASACRNRPVSPETRKKISDKLRGRKPSNVAYLIENGLKNRKPIKCLETGVVYESLKHASRVLGIPAHNLCDVCKGRRPTARGLHFAYVEEV